jgi:peptidoglycan hydrolase CwlO-like protein
MPSFKEMNYEVRVSIGMLMFIIFATFMVTNFYLKQNSLEDRMDKRHQRNEKTIEELKGSIHELDNDVDELFKQHNDDSEGNKEQQ